MLICLNNITIKDLKSLNPITKLFFKPLLNYLIKSYWKSNNINVGAIRTKEGFNFYYDQIGLNIMEFIKLHSLKDFLRFKSPLPSIYI